MELGRFVIGCCRPSLTEVEFLYLYYDTNRIRAIFMDIDERARRERMLQTRDLEVVKRLSYDTDWSVSADFLARADYIIAPHNHLEQDLTTFNYIVKQIIRRE